MSGKTVMQLCLSVSVPDRRVGDPVYMASALRKAIGAMSDDKLAQCVKTPEQVIQEFNTELKVTVPLTIRDYVRELLVKVNAASSEGQEHWNIVRLEFGTQRYDNGYFFVNAPSLVHQKENGETEEYYWEDVFGWDMDSPNLDEFTGDLSEAFGPLMDNSGLTLDMETGKAEADE